MYKYPNIDKLLSRRTFLLGIGKGALFSTVLFRLIYLQLFKSEKFKVLAEKNRISLRLIHPLRGNIVDRNGKILALNKNSYNVLLEGNKNLDEVNQALDKISRIIFLNNTEVNNVYNNLLTKKKSDLPIFIKKNLKWNELSSLNVNLINLPNVFIEQGIKREYPYRNLASHVIGYMTTPQEKDIKKYPFLKLMDADVGRFGIEESFEKELRGFPGTKYLEVNAYGREIREISKEESVSGNEVKLTIDINLQKYVNSLMKNISGSVVAIDVNNGEILALESSPNFDPNLFTKTISQEDWDKLINNPLAPMVNKSISGEYSPGSTFKLIVLYSALINNIIKPNNVINCSSKINFGDRDFYCWCHKKKTGCWANKNHKRNVGPELAIAQSCDSFFYELAKRLGIESIVETARNFGLGSKSGINLKGEKYGLVPNKSWKKKTYNKSWKIGETMITGVGQGFLRTTPIQLAVMTAMFANEGKKIFPTIYKSFGNTNNSDNSVFTNQTLYQKKFFSLIKNAMFSAVNKPFGTAFKSKIENPVFAGKTGTVQVRTISKREREVGIIPNKELPLKKRDHAMFVGFAPYDNPKIALSVVVEHGGSGSKIAAPIAKKIFKKALS
ncbi:MAG: Penicillin-binding protein 2 [Alphaproteobacteria bacterium MarineAlpha6_Bin4]|nr:MAG: Penicillin-binding protein 2 [Alphaproteobacteria bacterium MarineAlpha6_Bin3]PPR38488.1 MAG: Penicillin-binding protein 2 [Alphaproteobacteria bacterium MarineAlpha6_Bin4]|tara:strand:- start:1062 stop:2903 length:1842 start_codon:yes stop_codon:yes gene_type:complete